MFAAHTTQVGSFTVAQKSYEISGSLGQGFTCTCPDYIYRRAALGQKCKHILAHEKALIGAAVEIAAEIALAV